MSDAGRRRVEVECVRVASRLRNHDNARHEGIIVTHRSPGSELPPHGAEDFQRTGSGDPPPPPGYSVPGASQPSWLDERVPEAGDPPSHDDYVSFEPAPVARPTRGQPGRLSTLASQRGRLTAVEMPTWSLGSLLLALLGWSVAAAVIAWIVLVSVTQQVPGM